MVDTNQNVLTLSDPEVLSVQWNPGDTWVPAAGTDCPSFEPSRRQVPNGSNLLAKTNTKPANYTD